MSQVQPTSTATHVTTPWSALRGQLRGRLILPADEGYEEARHVWNGMTDRRPGAIAECAGADDVIAAVNFAREQKLLVAVRGGAHSAPGHSTCDGGLVIDLSPMKGISVDVAGRTARAEAGVKWNELDRVTQEHGLAVTGGTNSDTGIAGLTLGGGIGWLQRAFGLSCDNLLAADVVTADGQLLHASAEENPDLFWGVRGGGGNFGVVTAFEYRLHPVGPTVLAGPILYPLEQARAVIGAHRELVRAAPDELMVMDVLVTVPPAPPFPEPLHLQKLLFTVALYAGPVEQGEQVVAPLRQVGQPIADLIGPMPYTVLQSTMDATMPRGIRSWSGFYYLPTIEDEAIEALVEHFRGSPSPNSHVVIARMDGAVTRVAPEATAFGYREAQSFIWVIGAWPDAGADAPNISWTRGFADALRPYATGNVYVNGIVDDEGADRVRNAYPAATYERLVALKRKYDPTNLFHLNQNIKP